MAATARQAAGAADGSRAREQAVRRARAGAARRTALRPARCRRARVLRPPLTPHTTRRPHGNKLFRSLKSMGDHQHEQQGRIGGANGLELPPGFRFHPSDEEIITSYLRPKVLDHNFTTLAVGDADLNKTEPWELPLIANMGENEWYFFCRNDRKYPTGFRANRATEAGYWKATGKDKEIYRSAATESTLIGMKKTLVFYKGRAPKGVKTNWVMHEYRLPNHRVWAVCRVFHKCSSNNNNNAPELTTPASEPANDDMTMGRDSSVDSRSMSFPVPTKFPIESEDFTMDFSAPFYFADSTSPMLPALSPMVGMDSMLHQMNTGPFVDTMAPTQPMSFYHQVGIGTSSDCNFMAQPDSKPAVMLPGDRRMSPNQTSAAETSALTTAKPLAATAANIDDIWK